METPLSPVAPSVVAVSAVILAGGYGKRLGQDKAMLELDGHPLVLRVVEALGALTDDVIVVQRRGQQLRLEGVRLVADMESHQGVLAGIGAGLAAANHSWSLVVACDMPFLDVQLLGYMMSQASRCDAVVPRLERGPEPLHALYHRRCLPAVVEALEDGRRRVVSFYDSLRVRYLTATEVDRIDPTRRSFYNINTWQELAEAQRLLAPYSDTDCLLQGALTKTSAAECIPTGAPEQRLGR